LEGGKCKPQEEEEDTLANALVKLRKKNSTGITRQSEVTK
jgi:hypothetical protein